MKILKENINKHKLNFKLITEDLDDYFYEYDAIYVISQFCSNPEGKQNWGTLINPSMYQRALNIFTKTGSLDGFPTKYIYQWIGIIARNTAILQANTMLAGHTLYMDYDALQDSELENFLIDKYNIKEIDFGDNVTISTLSSDIIKDFLETYTYNHLTYEEDEIIESFLSYNVNNINEIKKKAKSYLPLIEIVNHHLGKKRITARWLNNTIEISCHICDILNLAGIYDWMSMPDGSDAWSDYGLQPLLDILSKYDDNKTTPEETLVLINKALDVTHCRGDMSSIFIQGGSNTLSKITNSQYINENTQKQGINGFIFCEDDWDAPLIYRNIEDMENGRLFTQLNVCENMFSFVMIKNKIYFAENLSHDAAILNALCDIHHINVPYNFTKNPTIYNNVINYFEHKFEDTIEDICYEIRKNSVQIEGRFWKKFNIIQFTDKNDNSINDDKVINEICNELNININDIHILKYNSDIENSIIYPYLNECIKPRKVFLSEKQIDYIKDFYKKDKFKINGETLDGYCHVIDNN